MLISHYFLGLVSVLFFDLPCPLNSIKRTLIMYKGLVIARKPILHNNEIVLTFQDSHGETIEIKQAITDVMGKTVRIRIEASEDVIGVYKLLS